MDQHLFVSAVTAASFSPFPKKCDRQAQRAERRETEVIQQGEPRFSDLPLSFWETWGPGERRHANYLRARTRTYSFQALPGGNIKIAHGRFGGWECKGWSDEKHDARHGALRIACRIFIDPYLVDYDDWDEWAICDELDDEFYRTFTGQITTDLGTYFYKEGRVVAFSSEPEAILGYEDPEDWYTEEETDQDFDVYTHAA